MMLIDLGMRFTRFFETIVGGVGGICHSVEYEYLYRFKALRVWGSGGRRRGLGLGVGDLNLSMGEKPVFGGLNR